MAAVGSLTRALGAEIEKAIVTVAQLREKEAAAIPNLGIVHTELVAVIAKRQRLQEISWQRFEAAEMPHPFVSAKLQSHAFSPAPVEKSRGAPRKTGGLHAIVELVPEGKDQRIWPIAGHRR